MVESKFIKILVSLGLTKRSTRLAFTFLSIFLFGIVVFIITLAKQDSFSLVALVFVLPLLLFDLFLGYVGFNKKFDSDFKVTEREHNAARTKEKKFSELSLGRKLYVGFACYGASVGIGMLLMCSLLVLGLEKYFEEIFVTYIFCIPIVCIALAPIMQRYLK